MVLEMVPKVRCAFELYSQRNVLLRYYNYYCVENVAYRRKILVNFLHFHTKGSDDQRVRERGFADSALKGF